MSGVAIAELSLALMASAVALWLKPWRVVGVSGPPWPWLTLWAMLPLLWGMDRHAAAPLAQPMSGLALLTLMAGWPLAILSLWPALLLTAWAGGLDVGEAVHRLTWLGLAPATLTLLIGSALRRWLPHHLFIYILGRGFLGTFAACAVAGVVSVLVRTGSAQDVGADLMLARVLTAFGEAFLTGMLTAIMVALRPQWLATYADRLYLPTRP